MNLHSLRRLSAIVVTSVLLGGAAVIGSAAPPAWAAAWGEPSALRPTLSVSAEEKRSSATRTVADGVGLARPIHTADSVVAAPTPGGENLLPNPSFEVLDTGGLPSSWTGPRWGENDGELRVSSVARTGTRSASLTMTDRVSGEIRLHHAPVAVAPATLHTFRYYFASTAETKMVADVTLTDGTHQYLWLGINPAAGDDWNEGEATFTTPHGAVSVAVSFYLSRVGSFTVDDVSLTPPPPPPPPSIILSATPSTIPAGAQSTLEWTVSGNPTSCIASDGWSGPLSATGSRIVSPTATQSYTLTCENSGVSATKSVTVTVNPVVPPPPPPPPRGNIAPNPSFEIEMPPGTPEFWRSSQWGTNNATFSLENGGAFDGQRYVRSTITSFTSGEASWAFTPQPAQPSTLYTLSLASTAVGPTKLLATIALADGTRRYVWLGTLPAGSTTWQEVTRTLTTPPGTVSITIGAYLTGIGSFAIDKVSLTPPQDTLPPPTAPVIALSANPSTIVAGAPSTLQWAVTGDPVTCDATGGSTRDRWAQARSPIGTWVVVPPVTTTYTLTCSNSVGSSSKTITVIVNPFVPPPPPPAGNIVPNPSFETVAIPDTPANWSGSKWGTNNATFAFETGGAFDGQRYVRSTITSFTSGEATWEFTPQPALPATTYTLNLASKAAGPTKLLATVTLTDGTRRYIWLGTLPVGTTAWQEVTRTVTTPPGTVSITVGASLTGIGSIAIDRVTLTPP